MDFLIKPCSFLFILFFTYFLKRKGVFQKDLAMVVLKIIMNITLPAVLITVFGTFERNVSLCILIILGLASSMIPYFLIYALTRKKDRESRVYYMICSSGFNIGCYGLPIIQAFYGAAGALVCVMFDIGNSVMMTSGNYAFTAVLLKTEHEEEKITAGKVLKKLFSSVPMDTYFIMFVACMAGLQVPDAVLTFLNPMASANAFLAMFMLGLLFEPGTKPEHWKHALSVLGFRYAILISMAVLSFLYLPFGLQVRKIVVLLLLCPIGSMAPAFVEKCHGDGEMAAFTNSISTLLSLISMTILVILFEHS